MVKAKSATYKLPAIAAVIAAGIFLLSYERALAEQSAGNYYRGSADGRVLIEEFSDFT